MGEGGGITKTEHGTVTFLGSAKTVEKWPLVVAGRYNTPCLLHVRGTGKLYYYLSIYIQVQIKSPLITSTRLSAFRSPLITDTWTNISDR